jgi:hypothetical protein
MIERPLGANSIHLVNDRYGNAGSRRSGWLLRLSVAHAEHRIGGAFARPGRVTHFHGAAWLRQNNPTGKISLNLSGKSLLQIRPSHPATGAYRDRHERGMGCGGRDSVGVRGDRRASKNS